MPDDRSLTEKLEAMAAQTVSPNEAAVARTLLERLQAGTARAETPGLLSREAILGAEDDLSVLGSRSKRVVWRGMTFILDEWDDPAELLGEV